MNTARSDEDILAAGAAAVAHFPALTDTQVATLARILSPLAADEGWRRLDTPAPTQRKAA